MSLIYGWALPTLKDKANIIVNLSIGRSQGIKEGWFLHILLKSEKDLILVSKCKLFVHL
jgi:hypothetical protein